MEYTISHKRLLLFMKNFLDTFAESKDISYLDPYIVIAQPNQTDDEGTWVDYMEYDHTDGRLWINRAVLSNLSDLFAMDVKDVGDFIQDWFEERFNVEVKFRG